MSCLAPRCDQVILEVIRDLNRGGVHGVLLRISDDDEHVDLRADGDVHHTSQTVIGAAAQPAGSLSDFSM